ncbi:MAG: hypothetical protein ACFN22_05595, partial [Porphyromonas pasteri]
MIVAIVAVLISKQSYTNSSTSKGTAIPTPICCPYGAGIRYEATKEGTLGTRVKKIEVFDFKA